MRRLLRLLPGFLLVAAASVVLLVPDSRDWAHTVGPSVGYVVALAGIVLGLRFRNTRVLLALIVLVLADQVIGRWAPTASPTSAAGIARTVVVLLVPLNLAALAWMPDRGSPWRRVRLWAILIAVQAIAVAVLFVPEAAEAARAFWRSVRVAAPLQWSAVFAFGVAVALALMRFLRHPRPTEGGFVWAVIAAFLALGLGADSLDASVYLATGSLILLVAVMETSHAMAFSDELTGLPSRRALNDALTELGERYTVAMVDIDHFKKFNDTYGHQAGDQLLRKVATTLTGVSGGGRAFRYGGEEFAVVFTGLSAEEATPHLEALRETIADSSFGLRGRRRPRRKPQQPRPGSRQSQRVTVSIGAADSASAGPAAADVVRAADEALYRAKRAGRNRLAV
ncbi:MAG TPA: GGDEF domain-containing protein [Methylomirabilota bacterium]|nr:GGDEF domain-containing protein [Methylomirabilota bacterium]